jgi:hypothetical protein
MQEMVGCQTLMTVIGPLAKDSSTGRPAGPPRAWPHPLLDVLITRQGQCPFQPLLGRN